MPASCRREPTGLPDKADESSCGREMGSVTAASARPTAHDSIVSYGQDKHL